MHSSTHSVFIAASAERVFGVVSDPAQIPRWGVHFCSSVRADGAALWAATPRGEVRFAMRADRALGVVDFGHLGADGAWRYSPTRVMPAEGGAVFLYTFFQRPGISDERFAAMKREMEEELALLKRLVEGPAVFTTSSPGPASAEPAHSLAREALASPAWRERLEAARRRDAEDPLAALRGRFHRPPGPDGVGAAYFCGNGLGLLSRDAESALAGALDQWRDLGFRAYFDATPRWLDADELLARRLAPIVGAAPEEVAVMGSVTANLHLLMRSFYRPTPGRHAILLEPDAFPSDRYVVASHARLAGVDPAASVREIPVPAGQSYATTEDVVAHIAAHGHEIALVLLGGVNHFSGQAYDLEPITRAAHAAGCLVGADLAHAIGNVALRLHDSDVDFAVWCHYKYLNADPGGVAGLFVHERHGRDTRLPRLSGWWGQRREARLAMPDPFEPEVGAWGFRQSGPPIASIATLAGALQPFEEAGMERLVEKREALVAELLAHVDGLPRERVEVITPREARGGQISLRVRGKSPAEISRGLWSHGVLVGTRAPDVVRIAVAPLYSSFEDVCRLGHALEKGMVLDHG
ncbi:kynureninase [Sorangium sp. So ce887]|uniref:kynureninase n=1 Tax=Sorangium sp. So ce887 TaxID=3133324 RepID=UPI003F5EDEF8